MKIKKDFFEKLSGAYDLLCSRINNCHNGGSSLEGLSTDSEFTLGLDNRGETYFIGGIALFCLFACILYIIVAGVLSTTAIPNTAYAILIAIFLFGAILTCIEVYNRH